MKTLKREEIYANHYRDLDHLRANIEAFIDQYDNRCRLHSALGLQIAAGVRAEHRVDNSVHRSDYEFF